MYPATLSSAQQPGFKMFCDVITFHPPPLAHRSFPIPCFATISFPIFSSLCEYIEIYLSVSDRVHYRASRAQKDTAPWTFSPLHPSQWPGERHLFGQSLLLFPRRSPPHQSPRRPPLKIGGDKRGPVQGMSACGPWRGWGVGNPENIRPGYFDVCDGQLLILTINPRQHGAAVLP